MPLPQEKYYTYADYLTWDDDVRCELIDGMPYMMPPAPTTRHQSISGNLHGILYNILKGKPCKVFAAPFDVRLNHNSYDDTVVQPDLVVICDRNKIDDKGCVGAPDMVIEILSPATASHDRIIKLRRYQKAGVREYWIVDPETKTVQVFIHKNGEYVVAVYEETETVPVFVLEGLTIDLKDVFDEK